MEIINKIINELDLYSLDPKQFLKLFLRIVFVLVVAKLIAYLGYVYIYFNKKIINLILRYLNI
jgi:hypothetical protein